MIVLSGGVRGGKKAYGGFGNMEVIRDLDEKVQ